MKHDPTFWLLARASGLTAYALLTASVLAGLVLKSRPFGRALKPAAVIDIHRFLALLGLGMLGAARRDARARPAPCTCRSPALLVPGSSPYRPAAVAAGVVAAELMLLIYLSFSLRPRIGTRNWRRLHWATYLVFALATVHGLAAGTDSTQPWARDLYLGAIGAVAFATAWRALDRPDPHPHPKGAPDVPHRDRPLALQRLRRLRRARARDLRARQRRARLAARRHERRPGRARRGRRLPDGRDHGRRGAGGMTRTVLIVGAGLAGARCAETLRAEGFDGASLLVGEEPTRPYERPALSKEFLAGTRDEASLLLRRPGFWDERGIELVLGDRVVRLDPRRVASRGRRRGDELRFDAARRRDRRPRRAGCRSSCPRASTRCARSPTRARSASELVPGTRLVVVGGGFVGAEVASTARTLGLA